MQRLALESQEETPRELTAADRGNQFAIEAILVQNRASAQTRAKVLSETRSSTQRSYLAPRLLAEESHIEQRRTIFFEDLETKQRRQKSNLRKDKNPKRKEQARGALIHAGLA